MFQIFAFFENGISNPIWFLAADVFQITPWVQGYHTVNQLGMKLRLNNNFLYGKIEYTLNVW